MICHFFTESSSQGQGRGAIKGNISPLKGRGLVGGYLASNIGNQDHAITAGIIMTDKEQLTNEVWQSYIEKGHVRKSVNQDIELALSGNYKADINYLFGIISKEDVDNIRQKFKTFKYRSKKETTTIAINKKTLDKLKTAASLNSINLKEDGYDLLFEILLSTRSDDYIEGGQKLSELPSAMDTDKFLAVRLRTDIKPGRYKSWLEMLAWVFQQGWNARSRHKGRLKNTTFEEELLSFEERIL